MYWRQNWNHSLWMFPNVVLKKNCQWVLTPYSYYILFQYLFRLSLERFIIVSYAHWDFPSDWQLRLKTHVRIESFILKSHLCFRDFNFLVKNAPDDTFVTSWCGQTSWVAVKVCHIGKNVWDCKCSDRLGRIWKHNITENKILCIRVKGWEQAWWWWWGGGICPPLTLFILFDDLLKTFWV